MRIVLALCTYKREEYLTKCLDSIREMYVPDGIVFSVLIVDNEPNNKVKEITENIIDINIDYHTEHNRGLCSARNKALKELRKIMPDYVGFIDDDEVVSKMWLNDMLSEIKSNKADIISGNIEVKPVISTPEALIEAYRFKGTVKPEFVSKMPMGNIFFSKSVLEKNLWFNKKFNHIGGEDIDFMERAYIQGLVLMKTPKGKVTEYLVEGKSSYRAYFSRQFRVFQNHYKQKHPRLSLRYLSELLISPAELISFSFLMLTAPFSSKMYVKGLKILARSSGRIMSRFKPKDAYV